MLKNQLLKIIIAAETQGISFSTIQKKLQRFRYPSQTIEKTLKDLLDAKQIEYHSSRHLFRALESAITKSTPSHFIGIYDESDRHNVLYPIYHKIKFEPKITNSVTKLISGHVYLATLEEDLHGQATCDVTAHFGSIHDPSIDVAIVGHTFDLPTAYTPTPEEKIIIDPNTGDKHRQDLTEYPFYTIDGDDAKDFDDAVCIKKNNTGYVLYVSIADVSEFVEPHTPLDQDAFARGVSVYFPNAVLPMLPEYLSNDLCSLKENENRLTLTAEMHYNLAGERIDTSIYKSVIRVKKRLTYNIVSQALQSDSNTARSLPKRILSDLLQMHEFSQLLRKNRLESGSIELNLPEISIQVDQRGEPTSIVKRSYNDANRIIEEFMLEANEAVCCFLTDNKLLHITRAHEPPDDEKITELMETIKTLGLIKKPLPYKDPRSFLQMLITMHEHTPFNHIISYLILRSLKQADYRTQKTGHFALSKLHYLHFTSPIRRYPDLMIHRIVKHHIQYKRYHHELYSLAELNSIAAHCSAREQVAMRSERMMTDIKSIRFLKKHVGNTSSGMITRIGPYGAHVTLNDFFIEGFIPMRAFEEKGYSYNEATKKIIKGKTNRFFSLGNIIEVLIENVTFHRLQITLRPTRF